eukprot:10623562-Lingulodinium_polyedra.AAC.1
MAKSVGDSVGGHASKDPEAWGARGGDGPMPPTHAHALALLGDRAMRHPLGRIPIPTNLGQAAHQVAGARRVIQGVCLHQLDAGNQGALQVEADVALECNQSQLDARLPRQRAIVYRAAKGL